MTSWLHEQRLRAAIDVVRERRAATVLDLGCGDGDLLTRLAGEPALERIVGIDLCTSSLRRLHERIARLETRHAEIDLIHGCMTRLSDALRGFDCAVLVETIEHIDPGRLHALERAIFVHARPATVVVTTPNAEFNPVLGVPSGRFRHPDHRFEWDRARFRRWVRGVAGRNGYDVALSDVAGSHPAYGGASQMAVFDVVADDADGVAA